MRARVDQTVATFEPAGACSARVTSTISTSRTAAGTAVVVVVGAERALSGAISPGDLVVFTAYLRRLYSPLKDLLREINKSQKARARAERVVSVLDTDPGVQDEPGARSAPRLRGHIRFEHVWFGYDASRPVLEDAPGVELQPAPRPACDCSHDVSASGPAN